MATVSSDRRQGVNSGTAVKVPCKAATTANVTLSGEQTVDGVALVTGDRVLVKDQTTASENGIYEVDTSSWKRAKDWDGSLDVKKGTLLYVHSGSTNMGFWYVTTSDPIIPGTTSVAFGLAFATSGSPITVTQLQNQYGVYVATVGGTVDAITLTPSTAITGYVAGQRFVFIAAGTNTTSVTVNVSGQGAKAVTKFGNTPLVAGDISGSGVLLDIEYDGTQFQLREFMKTGTSGHALAMLDADNTHSGSITMSAKSVNEAMGADIASAATTDIGAATGNFVDVTGTATITALGTIQAGTERTVRFAGATLTHNATSLILPGGANITTVSGDIAMFRSLGSGNWVCTKYDRADGRSVIGALTSGTVIVTTSGTAHDFTGIPSWVKRITLSLRGVSTSGTSILCVRIGDSGGIDTTGYAYSVAAIAATVTGSSIATGEFTLNNAQTAAYTTNGAMVLTAIDVATNNWACTWIGGNSEATRNMIGAGSKVLSATLDRIRLTTVAGTDTFDGGSVNILYE